MKIDILKFSVLAMLAAAVASSCDTDAAGTLYDGGGKAEYAFAADQFEVNLLVSDGNTVLIPIYRTVSSGTATVDVVLESVSGNADGVFFLKNSTVVFEDGENEAEVAVSYSDLNQIPLGDVYKFRLSFGKEQASPSGINSVTVSARRNLEYEVIGKGIYTCTFFTQAGAPARLEVTVEKAKGANAYRIPSLFKEGYPMEFSFNEDGEIIEFKKFATGYEDSTYGMLYFEYKEGSFRKNGNVCHFNFTVCSEKYNHDTSYDSLQLPQ